VQENYKKFLLGTEPGNRLCYRRWLGGSIWSGVGLGELMFAVEGVGRRFPKRGWSLGGIGDLPMQAGGVCGQKKQVLP
jgi:hypothetical protein